jgi:hypothetical protein
VARARRPHLPRPRDAQRVRHRGRRLQAGEAGVLGQRVRLRHALHAAAGDLRGAAGLLRPRARICARRRPVFGGRSPRRWWQDWV